METRRLKNIAILILLLLNAFLLLLLGYQYLHVRHSEAEAIEQLELLFAADQLALSPQADLLQPPLQPITLSRDTEAESAMAAFLLGDETTFSSQGGGIHSYSTDNGSIQFRSSGNFSGSRLSVEAVNLYMFAQDFFQKFDYVQSSYQSNGSSGIISAVQYVSGVPLIDCDVTLTFEDGKLTAVSGLHINTTGAVVSNPDTQLSCITALVRFLDYRQKTGIVCRQVEDIRCVYKLENMSSALYLKPVWQIKTDTYFYLVDCSSGEVTRQPYQ